MKLRDYEAMFVVVPDLKEEDFGNLFENLKQAILKEGGNIQGEQQWGKRSLSYVINKHKEAVYYLLFFQIQPGKIAKLENTYRLNEKVLRVLTVKKGG